MVNCPTLLFKSLSCSPTLLFNIQKKKIFSEIFFHFKISDFCVIIYLNVIYSCDSKLNFQHCYSSP